jgi:hypothetical protein
LAALAQNQGRQDSTQEDFGKDIQLLQTQLQHITSYEEVKGLIEKNPFVMICCDRMGRMCIPVYEIMDGSPCSRKRTQRPDLFAYSKPRILPISDGFAAD